MKKILSVDLRAAAVAPEDKLRVFQEQGLSGKELTTAARAPVRREASISARAVATPASGFMCGLVGVSRISIAASNRPSSAAANVFSSCSRRAGLCQRPAI